MNCEKDSRDIIGIQLTRAISPFIESNSFTFCLHANTLCICPSHFEWMIYFKSSEVFLFVIRLLSWKGIIGMQILLKTTFSHATDFVWQKPLHWLRKMCLNEAMEKNNFYFNKRINRSKRQSAILLEKFWWTQPSGNVTLAAFWWHWILEYGSIW